MEQRSELIGIYILSKLNKLIHFANHKLYKDDGLMSLYVNKRDSDGI